MTKNEVRDVILRMKKRLSKPDRWCQGAPARDDWGNEVTPGSPNACQWCLTGALWEELNDGVEDSKYVEVRDHLRYALRLHPSVGKHIDPTALVGWNDDPARTHEDVIAFLDEAMEKTKDASTY